MFSEAIKKVLTHGVNEDPTICSNFVLTSTPLSTLITQQNRMQSYQSSLFPKSNLNIKGFLHFWKQLPNTTVIKGGKDRIKQDLLLIYYPGKSQLSSKLEKNHKEPFPNGPFSKGPRSYKRGDHLRSLTIILSRLHFSRDGNLPK